jgi:hypothetical protein
VVEPFILPHRSEPAENAFGHQHCAHFDESSLVPLKSSENSNLPTGTGGLSADAGGVGLGVFADVGDGAGFGDGTGFGLAVDPTVNVFSRPTRNHADRDVSRTKIEYR